MYAEEQYSSEIYIADNYVMKCHQPLSNCRAIRNSSRSSFTRCIYAHWLSNEEKTSRPNTGFSRKNHLEKVKENGIAIASLILAISYHSDCWIVL